MFWCAWPRVCVLTIAESKTCSHPHCEGVLRGCFCQQEEGSGSAIGGTRIWPGFGGQLPPGRHLRAATSSPSTVPRENHGRWNLHNGSIGEVNHVRARARTHTCTHSHTHTQTHTLTRARARIHALTHARTLTRTHHAHHTHTTRARTHTHTHTHTQS